MRVFWLVISRLIGLVAVVFALFAVAWFFYLHSHASRNPGSVARSLAGAVDGTGDDSHCRKRPGGWRCTVMRNSDRLGTFRVAPVGNHCWKATRQGRRPGKPVEGCIEIFDYLGWP